MIYCANDHDDYLRHLLEQALLSPKQRRDLLQQQEILGQILNSIPARRWLFEQTCQMSDYSRATKARLLIIEIMQYSGNIWQEQTGTADDYDDSLARTWEWFSQKLCNYNPEQASFVTWFNSKLHWVIRDVIRERIAKETFIRERIAEEKYTSLSIPYDDSENLLFLEQVLELVRRDTDRQLRNCRMRSNPETTCQRVILLILQSRFNSSNIPWNDLAQTFAIDKNRLYNFCERTAFPCFKRFCKNNGLLQP